MNSNLTIGAAARITGVPPKTIRFYEDAGLLPRPGRTESGYRVYSETDIQRLQLVRRARLLGLDLPSIKSLLDKALNADCASFGAELQELLARQRTELEARIAELTSLRAEIETLQAHVDHCCDGCSPDQMACECRFCCLITLEEGGDSNAQQR